MDENTGFVNRFLSYNKEPYQKIPRKNGWEKKEIFTRRDIAEIITKHPWSPIQWRGGERAESNFVEASYAVFDIDAGLSIFEAVQICKNKRLSFLIAPTRSHGKSKNGCPARDRFRLILKFIRPVRSLAVYRHNLTILMRGFRADAACVDGARFFFPSISIVAVGQGSCIDVLPVPGGGARSAVVNQPGIQSRQLITRELGEKIESFLTDGRAFGAGRNVSIFVTAKALKNSGLSYNEVFSRIKASPFDRQDFYDKELIRTIKSAFSR